MKPKVLVACVTLLCMVFTCNVFAQQATPAEYKALSKQDELLTKQIKEKAVKQARKEAKKLSKEGFKTPVGKLPVDKQLEHSWQVQYMRDADGYPLYYVASARAIGGNHSSASMQATTQAKLDIAGQIQTKVAQLIEARIGNNELGKEEAASLNNVVSASKSVISNTLGRVLPLIEVYKTLPNKNVEVMVTLGYNTELATKEAIRAVQKEMQDKSDELAKQLDKLL